MAQLRETIAELEAILGDDVQACAPSSRTRWARSARVRDPAASRSPTTPATSTSRTSSTTRRLVVMMTANGYIKTVSADAFRTQGRGGRGVAGAKLKDEDYVTDIVTPRRTPSCCSSPTGAGVPAQGAPDPDDGADRARDRDREPAAAAAGRDDPDDHRHPGLRDQPVPVLRHPQRCGQEDAVQRLRLVACRRA
jgi:hypothetical protein